MNKTAIKNFAIWARNKLIADVRYRAGLVGITERGIQDALPQSDSTTEFYDIGTATPYAISGQTALRQRRNLAEAIRRRAADSDHPTAYRYIMEEVAYTWFNRLIAVRFMEVNDYLPGRVRVLSSESGKIEPDLVTNPFDAGLNFTPGEERAVLQRKQDNQMDELFRLLFIKQCNALHDILPALFERTEDYTELLLNLSVVDQDGVVWRLTHDIPEDDFNVERGGQVEIIGWLYQYYNTEPKAQVFARPSGQKIKKEEIPAATQLFTPDWIVRYMVENSLGRLWLEYCPPGMACGNGEDALRELWAYYIDEAEQEPDVAKKLEELRQQYRLSDPTQIKLIDPCMGSGHILVYAFDVLMQIYESQGYTQRDAAQNIVRHNLHGLDIDKRAYQLAYFAVMMKARQHDRRFLTRGIEPNVYEIQASSGKYPFEMGNFLLSKEHQETLNYLLEVFQDAKEYGSLLKLEQRDYAGLLEAWQNNAQATAENVNMVLWYSAVEEIVPALIKQALILTQKYEIVVTNPPYMGGAGMNGKLAGFVKKNYPDSKSDLSTAFMEQTIQLCNEHGYMAMINIPVWMFLSSYEKLREKMIANNTFINMVHPGRGIFGSDFGTTTFVIGKTHIPDYTGNYRRLFEKQGEVESIEEREQAFLSGKGAFIAQQDSFSKIPGAPVAYWVSKVFLRAFSGNKNIGEVATPKQGSTLGENATFLRFWFEIGARKQKWFNCMKGGEFRRWYGNIWNVLDWEDNGRRVKCTGRATIRSESMLFNEGITWSNITSGKSSFRYMPSGFFFESTGSVCFAGKDLLLYLLAYLNTPIVEKINQTINPTIHLQSGDIAKLPIKIVETRKQYIEEITKNNIDLSKTDWDSFETSWDFTRHPLVRCASFSMEEMAEDLKHHIRDMNFVKEALVNWRNECYLRFTQLKANEEELNRIFIDIYSLQDELTPEVADKDVTVHRIFDTKDEVPETMKGSNYILTKRDGIISLLSYAVGCMFGRYSLDVPGLAYAGGEWDAGKYSSFQPDADNILPLTDEAYLEDDIVTCLCQWLRVVYGPDTLEENLDFIAKALGNKGTTAREIIRNYFLKDFFANHCKIYQKRPIYWLFDSGKQNGFKALVYLHRYTPDTIGKLRVDYLHRLQRVYASEIERMQDMIDNSKNQREVSASTKRKEKLQKQLKECREYDEKIAHLALARIELDLDDGVKVNYRKMQTAYDGKLHEVLADSKNIMGKYSKEH